MRAVDFVEAIHSCDSLNDFLERAKSEEYPKLLHGVRRTNKMSEL